MKYLAPLILIFGLHGAAQERVVVPVRDTSRPLVVDARTTFASITVKTYNGKEVIVETEGEREHGHRAPESIDGLKRIDVPERGLEVEEENNTVNVRLAAQHMGAVVISVPVDTSLHLHSTHGHITADGVHGEVDATGTNGGITLTNISGTVVANTTNGTIKATMDRVEPGKPIAFSSTNGSIDVSLPADFKANVKLLSVRGAIYSDFDMKLTGGGAVTEPNTTPEGKFRVRFDRTITGTINGGGTEASFQTVNGRILLRKK